MTQRQRHLDAETDILDWYLSWGGSKPAAQHRRDAKRQKRTYEVHLFLLGSDWFLVIVLVGLETHKWLLF